MAARDSWNREQLIVALNLYWKIPYNKISGSSNSVIKQVESPDAVGDSCKVKLKP
jgi:hypothetical protein